MVALREIPGGDLAPLGTFNALHTHHQGAFRHVVYTRIRPWRWGAKLQLNPKEIQMDIRFAPLTFNGAEQNTNQVAVTIQSQDQGILIHNGGSHPIRQVILSGAADMELELRRFLEGEPQAGNPKLATSDRSGKVNLEQWPAGAGVLLEAKNGQPLFPSQVRRVVGSKDAFAATEKREGAWVFNLPVPLPVASLKASSNRRNFRLHRLDGKNIVEDIAANLVLNRVAKKRSAPAGSGMGNTLKAGEAAQKKAPAQKKGAGSNKKNGDLFFDSFRGQSFFEKEKEVLQTFLPDQPFSAPDFAIQPDPNAIMRQAQVHFNGQPTGARLGLATLKDGESLDFDNVDFFWRADPEEQRVVTAQVGRELGEAIIRLIRDLSPETNQVQVAIVVESDQPCRFRIDEFQLTERWLISSFAGGEEEKKKLRFPSPDGAAHPKIQTIPAQARVVSARITADTNLRVGMAPEGSAGGGSRSSDPTSTADPLAPFGKKGLALSQHTWTGIRLLAKPLQGLAVALQATVPNSSFAFQLREEGAALTGSERALRPPSAKVLVKGSLAPKAALIPDWHPLHFEATAKPETQGMWLLLRAVEGHGVWITSQEQGEVQLFQADPETGSLGEAKTRPKKVPRTRPIDHQSTDLSLAINNRQITPQPVDGKLVFDLAGALNSEDMEAEQETVQLTFRSSAKGGLTVYAPEILLQQA